MIKNTLSFSLLLSTFLLSCLAYAEEPYIGLGVVQHTFEQDNGNANDFEVEPSSYRITLGSRIAKNYLIEAYYLSKKDADEATLGITNVDFEYKAVVGAAIYRAFNAGIFRFYIGPNINAAKVSFESNNAALNDANDLDTRVSPGLGAGLDMQLYKKLYLNVNYQSYYIDSGLLGTGAGAELRYRM